MEHKLILGGEAYLPFARSRIKAMRATGLSYASQRFVLPDATVSVRIEPGQDYIHIDGGIWAYSVGIEANRVIVRKKLVDGVGDWKLHSTLEHAYANSYAYTVPFTKVNSKRGVALPVRSENLPGSDGSSTQHWYLDGFATDKKIYSGPLVTFLAGLHWSLPALVISTDGDKGSFVFSAVATDDPTYGSGVSGNYQDVIWKCEHNVFGTSSLTSKPTMWAFTYDSSTHLNYGLHTLMTENVVHLGGTMFCYGLGGSSQPNGLRDPDHKMVIIVTDNFESFTAYDVETQSGSVFGTDDFALSSCAYVGNGKVVFTGYGTGDLMLVFDSTTGAMTQEPTADSTGWSTTRVAIMPMGDDSVCYWHYTPGSDALNLDAQFVYTTDLGATWTAKAINCVDRNGDPLTIDLYLGTTTIRKPLVKVDGEIVKNGVLGAVFYVPGQGHCEFRTSDLGDTWREYGLISTAAAEPSNFGLLYRHVIYTAQDLPQEWT